MGNYYNYQIGVFFAILIGGLLLLFLFIAAIYFGCVVTMRPEKKRRYPSPTTVRAAPPRQWQAAEATNQPYTNLYAARTTPTDYVPAQSPATTYPRQPMSSPQELGVEHGYRPVQTEVYQQRVISEPAPGTWHPAPPATPQGYAVSPAQPAAATAYHTSSV